MTVSICCYSEDTLKITSEQLRTTNLIFAEHEQLTKTVPLLKLEISKLNLVNDSWEKTDSIRRIQLLNYETVIKDKNRSIEGLNKSLKRQRTIIKYGSVGTCILIVLCLLK